MNAVIYARYSSHGQRDVSIEDQVREITTYAKTHNYTIIRTYADRKRTGKEADKRKDFIRMIHDSAKHDFQTVLIYKHDRFARNKYDAVIYKKRLKDNGVKVIAVAEPIPDGAGAMILESIYEAMAEEYSANLSQNIKRGQKGNAMKAYANHKAPFGYIINHTTHKYDIDTENAPYVKTIFEMILQGKPHKEVLDYLAAHNKPHSAHWLYRTLRNERYTGVYIYADTRIEGGMPAIISKSDFDMVRATVKQRQQKPQLKPYTYLFSGKIYCGYCNALMNGESATSHTGTLYRYYCCPTAKKKKKCKKHRISADFIESKAIEALRSTIFTDEVTERLANDVFNYLNANTTEAISDYKKRLSTIEKSLANIISNMERFSHVPDALMQRMCDLEQEKNELLDRITTEQSVIDASQIKTEELKEFIKAFSQSGNRQLVNAFVTRLTVFNDYAILEYDASENNSIRIDFCANLTMVEQYGMTYKIANGTLYIAFSLAA